MNAIKLKGVLKNIKHSHTIGDVDYDSADLIVPRDNGKEDIVTLKFKSLSNTYKEDTQISIVGNVRSYSKQLNGKNKVSVYVFTYFDENEEEIVNECELDGRICKIDEMRTLSNGKHCIHFILANNLSVSGETQKLNSYLPCVAWGNEAKAMSQKGVNDVIHIKGELHSRIYKKMLGENDYEYRTAHEIVVTEIL